MRVFVVMSPTQKAISLPEGLFSVSSISILVILLEEYCMIFKKIALGLTLSAAFGLLACGDDESSSPVAPNNPAVSSSSIGTAGDVASSSSAAVTTTSSETTVVGSSSSAVVAASSSATVPNIDLGDFGSQCDQEGAKKDGQVMGMNAKLICEDGIWVADTTAMKEGLKCSTEGATKDSTMMGMTVKLVCSNGQWTSDNSCTEEGATQEMDLMGMKMTMVCKDGEWTMDASSFGGDDGIFNFADSSNTNYGRSDWGKWLNDSSKVVLD